MAAFVQGTGVQSAGSVNSVNKAYASNVTAGNLLVAVCVSSQQTMPAGSVTDSQGNTWALDKSQQRSPSEYVNIFSTVAGSTGANTVTLNCTGNDFQSLAIAEFSPSGGATWSTTAATRLGPTSGATGTTQTSGLAPGGMTAGADGVVVGGLSHGGGTITITPSSGTQVYESENATNMPISMVYLLATSGAGYNPSWSVASSTGGWTASGASYKETAGGGGGTAVPVFLHHMITQGMA